MDQRHTKRYRTWNKALQNKLTKTLQDRRSWSKTLFTGTEQFSYFNRLKDLFPCHTISASSQPFQIPEASSIKMPLDFSCQGQKKDSTAFLKETDTAALLVIHKGQLRYQDYSLTGGENVNWMSMSVGKSFVSALIGIALQQGLINDIGEAITEYVPELMGSAYQKVRIKDVLQMSSGARWTEDYNDPDSDIMRYIEAFGSGASLDQFTASLVRERVPGTYHYYNSTDTQALGMLLVRATQKSLAEYAQEVLWQPLGMQDNAFWICDDLGMEMAAGGLQVTARDYAKLGLLYLNKGLWQNIQVIPEAWVINSVTPDADHLIPDKNAELPLGYGHHWWIPAGDQGEFAAIGVYNQFIYINPSHDLVIVKLSANRAYGTTGKQDTYREVESLEYFRAIAKEL